MDQENDEEEDRDPWQVEKPNDRGARHETADRFEIAQGIARGAADPVGEGAIADQRIKPIAGPRKKAFAQEIIDPEKAVENDYRDHQPEESRHRSAREDAIVDLEHIDRAGQHQDIDRSREEGCHENGRPEPAECGPVGQTV